MERKGTLLRQTTLLVLILTVVSVMSIGYPAHAITHADTTEMTERVGSLNDLVFDLSFADWKLVYNSLKQYHNYDWMDWSTDGCSGPSGGRHSEFAIACVRHDLSWRTLAVIDEASGQVWNERNRFAADKQFARDTAEICESHSKWSPYPGIPSPYELCMIASSGYYTAVRSWAGYRSASGEETSNVSGNKRYTILFPGGSLEGNTSGSCAHSNEKNRCLPINYLELDGKPFAPQNISRFPSPGVALELQVIRANQTSVKGSPETGKEARNTGEMYLKGAYPLVISRQPNIHCPSQPGNNPHSSAYAEYGSYPNPNSNQDHYLKEILIYLKMCRATTAEEEETTLLDLFPLQAKRDYSYENWRLYLGDRVRDYSGINAVHLTASLSPNPDTYGFTKSDTMFPFTLTIAPAAIDQVPVLANVVANPPDTGPDLVEISRYPYLTEACITGGEPSDTLGYMPSGSAVYLGMCGSGEGSVVIRDPETGLPIQSYNNLNLPCLEDRGALTGKWTITGMWTTECGSTHRPGRYARFYKFTLSQPSQMSISLESADQDAYLHLLDGAEKTSGIIAENDDSALGETDSLIIRSLRTGTYVAEATTFHSGGTGHFKIKFDAEAVAPPGIVDSIPNQTIQVDSLISVDVTRRFSGGVEGYTARAMDSSIAIATASGSSVTVWGRTAGTTTIIVTASNIAGSATQSFTAHVMGGDSVKPSPPTNLSLSPISGGDSLRMTYARNGPPHYYQFQLLRRNQRDQSYTKIATIEASGSPTYFTGAMRGYLYIAKGRNCGDSARTEGSCGPWSVPSAELEFSNPTIEISELPQSIEQGESVIFDVHLSDLTRGQTYVVVLDANAVIRSGLAFSTDCTQSQKSIPFSTLDDHYTLQELSLVACGAIGGTVTAELKVGDSDGAILASESIDVIIDARPIGTLSPVLASISVGETSTSTLGSNVKVRLIANHGGDQGNVSLSDNCPGANLASTALSNGASVHFRGCRAGPVTVRLYKNEGESTGVLLQSYDVAVVAVYSASLDPVPSSIIQGHIQTFKVNTNVSAPGIRVAVNDTGDDGNLSLNSRCPAPAGSQETYANSESLTVKGCASGTATVRLYRDNTLLRSYTMKVEPLTASLHPTPSDITEGYTETFTLNTNAPAPGVKVQVNAAGDTGNLSLDDSCPGASNGQGTYTDGAAVTLRACIDGPVTVGLYQGSALLRQYSLTVRPPQGIVRFPTSPDYVIQGKATTGDVDTNLEQVVVELNAAGDMGNLAFDTPGDEDCPGAVNARGSYQDAGTVVVWGCAPGTVTVSVYHGETLLSQQSLAVTPPAEGSLTPVPSFFAVGQAQDFTVNTNVPHPGVRVLLNRGDGDTGNLSFRAPGDGDIASLQSGTPVGGGCPGDHPDDISSSFTDNQTATIWGCVAGPVTVELRLPGQVNSFHSYAATVLDVSLTPEPGPMVVGDSVAFTVSAGVDHPPGFRVEVNQEDDIGQLALGSCPGSDGDGTKVGAGGQVSIIACAAGSATIRLYEAGSSALLRSYGLTILPQPPSGLGLAVAEADGNGLALSFTGSGPPHHYRFHLYRADAEGGDYSLVEGAGREVSAGPVSFAGLEQGYWYRARGQNCLDPDRSVCGAWSDYTAPFQLPLLPPHDLAVALGPGDGDDLVVTFTASGAPHYYEIELYQALGQRGAVLRGTHQVSDSPASASFADLARGKSYKADGRKCRSLAQTVCGQWSGWSPTLFLNTPPAFAAASYQFSVAEDAGGGAAVGPVPASDADKGDILTYSITAGNDAGQFAIDGSTGVITVAGTLDRDTTASYSLAVEAKDSHGGVATATVSIAVTDAG